MQFGFGKVWRRAAAPVVLAVSAGTVFGALAPAFAGAQPRPNPGSGHGKRVPGRPGEPKAGRYYESFPHVADFGLTIDGALALAATGDEDPALREITAFIKGDGKDAAGKSVDDWDGHCHALRQWRRDWQGSTPGRGDRRQPAPFRWPRPDCRPGRLRCAQASTGGHSPCPAAGSFRNAASVFDQALGVLAQLRAGQVSQASSPIAYLEGLQRADGSFPSLIPVSGGPDVDSTAMAVMALALAPGPRSAADVRSGLAWIAGQQRRNGGFASAGGESVNSAGLAIQALNLLSGRLPAADQRGQGVPGGAAEPGRRLQRRCGRPARLQRAGVHPGGRRCGRYPVRHPAPGPECTGSPCGTTAAPPPAQSPAARGTSGWPSRLSSPSWSWLSCTAGAGACTVASRTGRSIPGPSPESAHDHHVLATNGGGAAARGRAGRRRCPDRDGGRGRGPRRRIGQPAEQVHRHGRGDRGRRPRPLGRAGAAVLRHDPDDGLCPAQPGRLAHHRHRARRPGLHLPDRVQRLPPRHPVPGTVAAGLCAGPAGPARTGPPGRPGPARPPGPTARPGR